MNAYLTLLIDELQEGIVGWALLIRIKLDRLRGRVERVEQPGGIDE